MNANILIVEDEQDIAQVMILYLKKEGASPYHAETGEEALTLFARHKMDLVILDINLPGMDGFDTLGKIRAQGAAGQVPVILVSARQEDADMIMGFGMGADDYVTKPFSPGVLMARIRAHLRRNENRESLESDTLTFGPWILDRTHQILSREGRRLNLSPREMELLCFLTENQGRAFSQQDLYRQIWGNDYGDLSTVSVHIQRLRKKIEEDPSSPRYVCTRYGYGYYFAGDRE